MKKYKFTASKTTYETEIQANNEIEAYQLVHSNCPKWVESNHNDITIVKMEQIPFEDDKPIYNQIPTRY